MRDQKRYPTLAIVALAALLLVWAGGCGGGSGSTGSTVAPEPGAATETESTAGGPDRRSRRQRDGAQR